MKSLFPLRLHAAAAIFTALVLAGCGGGGGSSSTGTTSGTTGGSNVGETPAVSLSPNSINASFVSGASMPITVIATPNVALSGVIYATIIDSQGVLAPEINLAPNANGTYTATLFTSSSLQAGDYSGTLQVNLCYDAGCVSKLAGSPISVPFTFKVTARVANVFSVAPASLTGTVPVGTSGSLALTLTPSQNITTAVFVRVDDTTGVLKAGGATVIANANGTYAANIPMSTTAASGEYTGNFKIHVCNDLGCTSEVAGSPFLVPFDIQIAARSSATFTALPATLSATYYAGASASLALQITPQQAIQQTVYFKVSEPTGLLQAGVSVTPTTSSYVLGLKTSATIAAGHYTGTVNVSLCSDAACASPITATPVNVPFDFQVNVPPPPLLLSPSSLSGTFTAGFPNAWSLAATLNSTVSGTVYVAISDSTGRFQSPPSFVAAGPGNYTLTLRAATSLSVGHFTGSLTLNVCRDSACSQPVLGSPMTIPYDITARNLTTLSAWPGIANWEMYQGNAAHTAFVPVTIDVASIIPRWTWSFPVSSYSTQMSPVSVSANQIYVESSKVLYALNENDRAQLWSRDFSALNALNPPSATNGSVYIATSGHQDTFMWKLAAADGTVQFKTPFSAQWENYLSPTIDSGVVFTDGGGYGGMYAFNAADGSQKFYAGLQQFDGWTPAVDANYAYAYIGGQTAGTPAQLNLINRTTGALVVSIPDTTYSWAGYTMNSAPVLGAAGSVFAINVGNTSQNVLLNFDTVAKSVKWSMTGRYAGNPAYTNGEIFATNTSPLRLEVRAEFDGAVKWSWTPNLVAETGFVGDVLVTNNLVFVSTNVATYAISRSTHAAVWSFPKPGRLALSSNGVLYITGLFTEGSFPIIGDVVAFDVK